MDAKNDSAGFSHSQQNAGDEVFDLCCDKCSTQNLNKEAGKYCATCKEYFCDSCVQIHNSFKVMSSHILVDPRTTTSSTSQTGMYHAVPKEMCVKHPMEIVNMYCVREDIVGCSVCFSFEHKSCDDIHYIPQYVQSNFPTEQIKQVNNDLTKAIKAMQKVKTQHDRLDDNLDKSEATCRREIQKYREEINHIIDGIESATLADLDARHKDIKKKTVDTNHNIQKVHDEMIRFKSEIESDQSNDSQKFVIAKLSHCMMKQGQELQSQIPHDQTTELTFSRNTDIMTFLLSLVTLGMLSHPLMHDMSLPVATCRSKQQTQTESTSCPSASCDNGKTDMFSTIQQDTKVAMKRLKQGLYKVVEKSRYNMQQPDDNKTCGIRSSCILDNGNILLADYYNNKLKLVDGRTYTIVSSLALDAEPMSVCRVSSTEAAVCVGYSTIQFVSSCDKLVPVRSLSMSHYCSCIAVIRDKMYVCGDKSVFIYTLNGELVQTISKDKSGNSIFSTIFHITVSDDENMIHVASWNNGLITLNTDGNEVWRYSSTELSNTCGVCTDGNGHVLVCGNSSHNVIQLGLNGQYIGEIATHSHGVKRPRTVCFDRSNHKLIVGQYENSNIKVFTVE